MKQCKSCNKILPTDSFSNKRHTNKDGSVSVYKRSRCRACTRKENTDRYHGNPSTKTAHREAAYRYTIKKYGLTVDQYENMLREQNNRCFICDTHEDDTRFGKLCIDHDHSTGKVRKLLCSSCNTALGMVSEDKTRLKKLVSYLEAH